MYKPSIRNLIGWGANYEDKAFSTRPLRHFFNPLNNRGLRVFPFPEHTASPDWALEDGDPQPTQDNQDNSLFDTYDFLRKALGKPETPGGSTAKAYRDEHWGKVFQSLGMVIHHIQDMAQPQHVRQDSHCNSLACIPFFYNPSLYEEYTNINRARIVDAYGCNHYPTLDLNDFSRARDFWTTGMCEGQGIAEFTNRNFVSAGSNFYRKWSGGGVLAAGGYPNPDPQNWGAGLDITRMDIRDPTLMGSTFELPGEIWFYGQQRILDPG